MAADTPALTAEQPTPRILRLIDELPHDIGCYGEQAGGCYESCMIPELRLHALSLLAALAASESRVRELTQERGIGGAICPSHGLAVLVTHVNDGEPCSDFLLAVRSSSGGTPTEPTE